MDSKIRQYAEHFGESFPTFMVGGMSEEELTKIIDECIEKDEPYRVKDDDPSILYQAS